MCVGCISMVDAVSSGVVYTRDPVWPGDGCMVVNSVFGLGQLLVDGTLTPDVFRVRRDRGEIVEARVARKPQRLVMKPEAGTVREPVPEELQTAPSLEEERVRDLARMALEVEAHYGAPQDLEWALDRSGRLFLLQTRPLQLLAPPEAGREPDVSGLEILLSGGTTVCPGAGCGTVHHAASSDDLPAVPTECVLPAPHPFPGLVSVLGKISALITEVGGMASHTATLAREYRVPTIMGLPGLARLPAGSPVTVDATDATVYAGEHPALVRARWIDRIEPEGDPLQRVLRRVLACMSPLNLLYPSDPCFVIENCHTLHDITRFCHQKSMQELFERTANLQEQRRVGLRLRSDIPLHMNIVCLERPPERLRGRRWVEEKDLLSLPMQAFWSGIKREGWPSGRTDLKGLASATGPEERAGTREGFSEDSYAVLSREYMVASLRMGYHFTTVEALCSEEPSKNFITMQYKQGGAALERRQRRLRLITTILSTLGFENLSEGDFMDSRITYLDREAVLAHLRVLGRLMIMTKQLDMALSSDSIAAWYTRDFMKKLGLMERREIES
jgi:pyruvate,water dikinase